MKKVRINIIKVLCMMVILAVATLSYSEVVHAETMGGKVIYRITDVLKRSSMPKGFNGFLRTNAIRFSAAQVPSSLMKLVLSNKVSAYLNAGSGKVTRGADLNSDNYRAIVGINIAL